MPGTWYPSQAALLVLLVPCYLSQAALWAYSGEGGGAPPGHTRILRQRNLWHISNGGHILISRLGHRNGVKSGVLRGPCDILANNQIVFQEIWVSFLTKCLYMRKVYLHLKSVLWWYSSNWRWKGPAILWYFQFWLSSIDTWSINWCSDFWKTVWL